MNQEPENTAGKEENQDSLSRKDSESSSSSDYVVVVGDNNKGLTSPVLEFIVSENDLQDAIANPGNMINSPSTPNVVGKSIFYDCLNDPSPLNENMSSQKSDTDDGMNHFTLCLCRIMNNKYLHRCCDIRNRSGLQKRREFYDFR